jgi:hypothetical protein
MPEADPSERSRFPEWALLVTGILLAMALSMGLGWLSGRESERGYQSPHGHAEQAKASARRACVGTVAVSVFECVYDEVEASEETARAEQDLRAQRRDSLSSLTASVIAFFALISTGVGIVFLKRTLDATAGAVLAQIRAERPHVRLFSTKKRKTSKGELVELFGVTFRNYGRTPAVVKSLSIKYAVVEHPPFPRDAGKPRIYPDDSLMPQDEEWPRKHYIPQWEGIDLSELVKFHDPDGARLYVFGVLTYEDAFKELRETRFCRVWDGKGNFTVRLGNAELDSRNSAT